MIRWARLASMPTDPYLGCPLPKHVFDRSGAPPGQRFLDALGARVATELGDRGGELALTAAYFRAPERVSKQIGHVAEGLLPAIAAAALEEIAPPESIHRVGTFSFLLLPALEASPAALGSLHERIRDDAALAIAWYLLREVLARRGESPDARQIAEARSLYEASDPDLCVQPLTLRAKPGAELSQRASLALKEAGHAGFWPRPWPPLIDV